MIDLAACVAMHAFTPALAQRAAREGAAMADARASYAVAPWVIYQSKNPLRATHGRAGVDAIVIETPYERVRYYGYLHRLQGDAITGSLVHRLYDGARGRLGFVVYAHSKSDADRGFLSHFSVARLAVGGTRETAYTRAVFGPSMDFYDVAAFREQRWVGSITYRFPMPRCSELGSVRFADGYGDTYRASFDLSRYR